MALTYKGTHHRNPSGLHAKVKWIEKRSCLELKDIDNITLEIIQNLSNRRESGEMDAVTCQRALESWHAVWVLFKYLLGDEKLSEDVIKHNLKDSYDSKWFADYKEYVKSCKELWSMSKQS